MWRLRRGGSRLRGGGRRGGPPGAPPGRARRGGPAAPGLGAARGRGGKPALRSGGNPDKVGRNQNTKRLGGRRAVAVAHYLEPGHVGPLRPAPLGRGGGEPVASNNTESGRSANRRVEIYVESIVG